MDVGDAHLRPAPVGAVARRLLRIEIIGEDAAPALAETGPRHAAAGEKFVEGALLHVRTRLAAILGLRPNSVKRKPPAARALEFFDQVAMAGDGDAVFRYYGADATRKTAL